MQGRKFTFDFSSLGLTVSGIEEVMGYNENDDREFMRSLIDEALNDCRTISEVKAEYRIFNDVSFFSEAKRISVADALFNVDKIVFAQLKRADAAALFVCTAGPETGRKSRQFMSDRDLLAGYIYDVIGSEIVEAAADLMQADLEASAMSEGLNITNRYSPGYCGWNVSEQHKFFTLMADNHCGIKVLPSALMDPEKSVSGIIGIGSKVRKNPYTCRMCEMKDCIYRRLKEGGSVRHN